VVSHENIFNMVLCTKDDVYLLISHKSFYKR
jgi:hypothetical protein